MVDYALIADDPPPPRSRIFTQERMDPHMPWAYSDGAAHDDGCGRGAILHISTRHSYSLLMGLRQGTNNFTKLSVAMHIIQFDLEKNCHALQLFGDSKIVCDWLIKTSCCWSFSLRHILDETLRLLTHFEFFTCNHIYREWNIDANHLSKEATLWESGISMI